MDEWMGGWMDGWMDICMDGWMDRWMEGGSRVDGTDQGAIWVEMNRT